jgi:hypothetical protein
VQDARDDAGACIVVFALLVARETEPFGSMTSLTSTLPASVGSPARASL